MNVSSRQDFKKVCTEYDSYNFSITVLESELIVSVIYLGHQVLKDYEIYATVSVIMMSLQHISLLLPSALPLILSAEFFSIHFISHLTTNTNSLEDKIQKEMEISIASEATQMLLKTI